MGRGSWELGAGGRNALAIPCLPFPIRQHGIAQRAAHAPKDGGAQQKRLHVGRLAVQHLFQQVIEHKVVAAAERADKAGRVGVALQRKRGQLQAGDPALGARLQRGHVGGGEVQAHALAQKRGRLLKRKAQIGGAQLGQPPARAQTRQRQLRIFARGEHQVQLRGQVLEQKGQCRVDGGRLQRVVVVEHQDHARGQGVQLVQQRGEDRFGGRGLRRIEQGGDAAAKRGLGGLQRRDQVGQKARRVVFAGVERQPGHARSVCARRGQPLAQQRGFAKAGRRRKQRQGAPQAPVQARKQARARDAVRRRRGKVELGAEHGRWHGAIIPGFALPSADRDPARRPGASGQSRP